MHKNGAGISSFHEKQRTQPCNTRTRGIAADFSAAFGFVTKSFFFFCGMRSGGALSVRANLSGLSDDANGWNENLCYLESRAPSVIEIPTSFLLSHKWQVGKSVCAGENHPMIQCGKERNLKKKKFLHWLFTNGGAYVNVCSVNVCMY